MRPQLVAMFQEVSDSFNSIYGRLKDIKEGIQTESSLKELADTAYSLRESHKYLNDLAKEVKRSQELAERVTCLLWVNTSNGETIRTEYCSATPVMKSTAAIPKKRTHPERYAALMKYLGVPEKLWSGDLELVRVHWPSFVEFTTNLEEQGKPLPKGVEADKAYTVYCLRIQRRKNVNED